MLFVYGRKTIEHHDSLNLIMDYLCKGIIYGFGAIHQRVINKPPLS